MAARRNIVVTGATRGLGKALVARFVESGHAVAGVGTDLGRVEEMRRQYPSPHRFDRVDVSDDAAVSNWAEQLARDGFVPDLLINNAAIITPVGPLWEAPADEFQRIVNVNIVGVVNVLRHVFPQMLTRESGVVINLSSGWGRSTSPDVGPYCATKYAVEGMSLAMAQEVPAGFAVVAMNPGIIDTDMLRTCWADGASRFPDAETWSQTAAPYFLSLGRKHNGQSLTAPG